MASALKRATQMGEFEVAKGGGIWVANRARDPASMKITRVDWVRVDATTEEEIQAQIEEDEKQAMLNAGLYVVGIRRRLAARWAVTAGVGVVCVSMPATIGHVNTVNKMCLPFVYEKFRSRSL